MDVLREGRDKSKKDQTVDYFVGDFFNMDHKKLIPMTLHNEYLRKQSKIFINTILLNHTLYG